MHPRSGFTIMEIMMAVTMASFMAAIGFTGISAFGKSITRSKQFTSESELVIACMRMAIEQADAGENRLVDPGIHALPYELPVPRNWVKCTIDTPDTIKFEIADTLANTIVSAGGGDGPGRTNVKNGLNMSGDKNTLTIKTLKSKF